MKKNRLISLGFIIAAVVFASFFGGKFSYALLYASFAVPVTCLIYLLFVFTRLKVYQAIDSKIVVKGEKIGFKYILSNESSVYFTHIKPEFLSDYSKVDVKYCGDEISLAPGQKTENLTELTCLYRGEYMVGLKSIVITDYLRLFKIRRGYPSTLNIRVYPRIVKLNSLNALSFGDDIKSPPYTLKAGGEQDADLRAFAFGDNVKAVNWKVSAKHGELFTRRRTEPPKEKIALFIDTSPITHGDKIPAEDRILEVALAVSDFYLGKNIENEIIYPTGTLNRIYVNKREDFMRFYDACLTLPFKNDEAHNYLENITTDASTLVLITAKPERFAKALSSFSMQTCVILTADMESESLAETHRSLGKASLLHIPEDRSINDALGG